MVEKKTNSPIPFELLQACLSKLGYGLQKFDAKKPRVYWVKERNPPKHLIQGTYETPEILVTLMPDCIAAGYHLKVYDRDYVVDLLDRLTGAAGRGAGTQILLFLSKYDATPDND